MILWLIFFILFESGHEQAAAVSSHGWMDGYQQLNSCYAHNQQQQQHYHHHQQSAVSSQKEKVLYRLLIYNSIYKHHQQKYVFSSPANKGATY